MSNNAIPTKTGAVVEMTAADFIPFPKGNLTHRGVTVSRATLWRAKRTGTLKTRLFRQVGSVKGRRYILRESLDEWIAAQMVDEDSPLVRKPKLGA
jgi:hypothetical protein